MRLNIALVQQIKSRLKSRKSKKSDSEKTMHVILINVIVKFLFMNDISISEIKNCSWYFFENKRHFNLMYKACLRNVQCLLMNYISISYDAATSEFEKKRQWKILSFLSHSDEQRHKVCFFEINFFRMTHLLNAALDNS